MANAEKKSNKGQLPKFVTALGEWFFFIRWEDDVLYYSMRWSPNIDALQQVADHFKCGFILEFDELMMKLYGLVSYEDKTLNLVELTVEDFDQYSFNEKDNCWIFRDCIYYSEYEILDILLEGKQT